MGLTKVTGFTGEAELQGGLYPVSFEHDWLRIGGLTLAQAYDILDALAAKTIVSVRVQGKDANRQITEPATPEPKEPTKQKEDASPPKRSSKDQVPKEEKKAGRLPTPEPEESKPETPAPAPPAEKNGAIPEKVATSARFIDVLDWVMKSNGFKSEQVDEIVAAFEPLKELPVVKRVRDLRDKVVSNLAAYAEVGNA